MEPKEKAKELFDNYYNEMWEGKEGMSKILPKKYAVIAIENEYYSLREQLINLRSTTVIESERVFLTRLQRLIDEEKEVLIELEKL